MRNINLIQSCILVNINKIKSKDYHQKSSQLRLYSNWHTSNPGGQA